MRPGWAQSNQLNDIVIVKYWNYINFSICNSSALNFMKTVSAAANYAHM